MIDLSKILVMIDPWRQIVRVVGRADNVVDVSQELVLVVRNINHFAEIGSRSEDRHSSAMMECKIRIPWHRQHTIILGSNVELNIVWQSLVIRVIGAHERFKRKHAQHLINIQYRLRADI